MGVKVIQDMSPQHQVAMKKILEGARELGWAIAIEDGDTKGNGMIRGLLMGEKSYLDEFDVAEVP